MAYAKTIVCLANSRKLSGRCIAGKELLQGEFGQWVRPVSARASEEINEEERRYENGDSTQVLDIVSIRFREHRPHSYQTENHLIDDEYYWAKSGAIDWHQLQDALDVIEGPLWANNHSTYNGINDQVPEHVANTFQGSLKLLHPNDLRISVGVEGGVYGPAKRRVRASFVVGQFQYKLMVTDPQIERHYLKGENGEFPIDEAIICVSLGELFHGYAYKLVASIFMPD